MEVARRAAARPEEGAPRARRQGAGHRLRRRRHRGGGRGDRRGRATSTPARTAPPPLACSPARACTTTSSPRSPSRPRTPRPACPTTRTCSTARSTTPTSSTASPASSTGCPTTPSSRPAATGSGDAGYFYEPDRRLRPQAGRRGRSRTRSSDRSSPCSSSPTRTRRCAGPTACSTASPRQCLDQGPRPRDADGQQARLRLRLDQHPHPVRRRDAARRLQALGLRQGPVDVRPRGLHPHQARHVTTSASGRRDVHLARRVTRRRTSPMLACDHV